MATLPTAPPALPDSQDHLDRLVVARMLRTQDGEAYTFWHALMHQAVYSTLLRRERRTLHRAVAQTLVSLYGDTPQFNRYLGDLAYHYAQAEDFAEALHYAQAAGEEALARFAPQEAVEHFTRALEATRALAHTPGAALYRQRGRAHETLGDFAGAQADYASALAAATAAGQPQAEWQALLDLGLLWSGRDYQRAGAYYQQALTLARRFGQGATLAHSLNRMGNWHLNQGEPQAALVRHHEALGIFEDLSDSAGQADTYDLLGMTSFLGGDLRHGTAYYHQAVALFRQLDNRGGLASSLAAMMLRSVTALTDTLPAQAAPAAVLAEGEEALAVARGMRNRPGEAFALALLSMCASSIGAYTDALALGHDSLELADAIGHAQWQTCALCSLGVAYLDLGERASAAAHLARARELADAINSHYWQSVTRGWLALSHLGPHATAADYAAAHAVLDPVFDPAQPPAGLGWRVIWCARVELALAEGQAHAAVDWLDQLLATIPQEDVTYAAVPRLACLRAEALRQLGRLPEARQMLAQARRSALDNGAVLGTAHLLLNLGRLADAAGDHAPAAEYRADAEAEFVRVAANLTDPALRATFQSAVAAWLRAADASA